MGEAFLYLAAFVGILFGLRFFIGVQAFGLPAIIGLAVLFGMVSLVGDLGIGPVGVVLVVVGIVVVLLVIGMAMSFGGQPRKASEIERPLDDY